MHLHSDTVFAPLDRDLAMERIGGGYETEVYRTDDRQFVVKVKHEVGADRESALRWAQQARQAAERYAECLGQEHSLPNYYLIARDNQGRVQPLVIQPFIANARPLADLDYRKLKRKERKKLAKQLRRIVQRSFQFYREHGTMPDLYGQRSRNPSERAEKKQIWGLPKRIWSFLVKRSLLRSNNLMITDAPERRIVLVDYDTVPFSPVYRLIYFSVRILLFVRDWILIEEMRQGGPVPKAE